MSKLGGFDMLAVRVCGGRGVLATPFFTYSSLWQRKEGRDARGLDSCVELSRSGFGEHRPLFRPPLALGSISLSR